MASSTASHKERVAAPRNASSGNSKGMSRAPAQQDGDTSSGGRNPRQPAPAPARQKLELSEPAPAPPRHAGRPTGDQKQRSRQPDQRFDYRRHADYRQHDEEHTPQWGEPDEEQASGQSRANPINVTKGPFQAHANFVFYPSCDGSTLSQVSVESTRWCAAVPLPVAPGAPTPTRAGPCRCRGSALWGRRRCGHRWAITNWMGELLPVSSSTLWAKSMMRHSLRGCPG